MWVKKIECQQVESLDFEQKRISIAFNFPRNDYFTQISISYSNLFEWFGDDYDLAGPLVILDKSDQSCSSHKLSSFSRSDFRMHHIRETVLSWSIISAFHHLWTFKKLLVLEFYRTALQSTLSLLTQMSWMMNRSRFEQKLYTEKTVRYRTVYYITINLTLQRPDRWHWTQ